MVLPLLKIAGGAEVHLRFAVMAVNKPGKQAALARLCPPMPLLAYLLYLVEHFRVDNRLVRLVENGLLFGWIVLLILVPDGIGVGLKIDGVACVLLPFKDMDNGVGVSMVQVCAFPAGGIAAFSHLVGGGVEYPFLLEQLCNLQGASALHTKGEYPLDDCRRFLVHKPAFPVLRVADIAVGDIGGKTLALCLVHCPDFSAGISGVKFVKPVLYPGKVIIHVVGVEGVVVVIDGNKADAMLGKVKLIYIPTIAEFLAKWLRSLTMTTPTRSASISSSISKNPGRSKLVSRYLSSMKKRRLEKLFSFAKRSSIMCWCPMELLSPSSASSWDSLQYKAVIFSVALNISVSSF